MSQPKEESPLLSQRRSFVVQFRKETDVEQGRFRGRVEHVVSGRSQRFQSLEELIGFIGEVLAEVKGAS